MAESKTWTGRSMLDWSKGYFAEKGLDSPMLDAQLMLGRVLGMDKMQLLLNGARPLDADELARYKQMVIRRAQKREPVAYVLGTQGFWTLDLDVTPDVLVPRADTECLVEKALDFARARLDGRGLPWPEGGTVVYEKVDDRARYYGEIEATESLEADVRAWIEAEGARLKDMTEAERVAAWEAHTREGRDAETRAVATDAHLDIADVGTGSGAIILALASELPAERCHFWAGDISEAALDVARANAQKCGLHVEFAQGDLLDGIDAADVIVSNPPYVTTSEMQELQPEVRREPEIALVAGADGLDVYRRLVPQAAKKLRNNGALLVEIGCRQADAVEALFRTNGFTHVRTFRDYGRQPRVVFGLWEG